MELHIFESTHSHLHETVPEYGFSLEYNNKNYVFVGDIRTYDTTKFKKFANSECLFVHLWLGKANALNIYSNEFTDDFCTFANCFEAKKVYIAHTYDVRRTIKDMWSDVHFDIIKGKVNNSILFKIGDWYEL